MFPGLGGSNAANAHARLVITMKDLHVDASEAVSIWRVVFV